MALVIGIDGGGSKTTAALSDGTSVLGACTAAGCNINTAGVEAANLALTSAVQGALAPAGISAESVSGVCAGVAGAASPEVAAKLAGMLAALLPRAAVRIVGDTLIALESDFQGGPGVVCISGTGSIAFGRNERGETARAGGWGRLVSDEGSGTWIGLRAISECLHALDMGRSSGLVTSVMHHWQIATREQLVFHCNREQIPNFADVFPLVEESSEAGDPLASEILAAAGTSLARVAQIVLRRLWVGQSPVEMALTGGVFANSGRLRQVFCNVIRSERPEVSIRLSQREPYMGAIYLAQRSLVDKSR